MNRLLLLCLLASIDVCAKGTPPFINALSETNSATFLLIDTIPPTIQCPGDLTLQLGVGECDTMFSYMVVANDDQPNFILIQLSGLASGSAFQVGTTLNAFVVTDLAANTASCSFSVTVQSAGGATPLCEDIVEIEMGPDCELAILPEDVLLPPYGCTANYKVEVDKAPPLGNGPWVPAELGIGDLGKLYAFRLVDTESAASCWGTVKIIDPPPTIACTNVTVHCAMDNLNPLFLRDSLGIVAGYPTVNDNCPGYQLTFLDFAENLPCNPLTNISGTVNRVWIVTDTSGNTASCQQTIVRQRTFAGIEFPANDTASCTEQTRFDLTGAPYLQTGNYRFTLWPSSYCEFEVQYFDTLQTAYCDGGGRYKRSWKIFDLCQPISPDNPLNGTQIIDFLDTGSPKVTCDSSVTVVAEATDCRITFDLPEVFLSDACSPIDSVFAHWVNGDAQDSLGGSLSIPDTLGIFGEVKDFPAFNTTITYVAVDGCGNTGSCQTLVTVWDTDPPVANCITFFTVTLDDDGEFVLGADTLDLSSGDSCSSVISFKMRRSTPSAACAPNAILFDDAVLFCCADAGDTIELTRRVYDIATPDGPLGSDYGSGQFTDCIVRVEVLDTLPLACIAPPDVDLTCVDFDLQSSDLGLPVYNCSVDSFAVSLNTVLFDSTCSEGLITRTFRVFDKSGNSAECVQQIVVAHEQEFYIKFPNDLVLTNCAGGGFFGEPEYFNVGCENMAATWTNEKFTVVPDACFKIERTWTIYNTCTYDSTKPVVTIPNPSPNPSSNHPSNLAGPIVSAPGTAVPWASSVIALGPGQSPTDFSTFWDKNVNAYRYKQIIKIVDMVDPLVDNCPSAPVFGDTTANDTLLWNQTYWWDGISKDLCEGDAPLSITAGDACSGNEVNISYLLFLNTDNDNTQETVINSNNTPAPGTVNFNNFSNPNFNGGTARVFDGRPVLPNEIYRWALHQSVSGDKVTASVQWKTFAQMATPNMPYGLPGIAPQLPLGTHRIRWTVTDGCGNENTCEYSFTVRDAQKPTLDCTSGQSFEIPLSGTLEVPLDSLLFSASDNCTPDAALQYGLRVAGSGSGFPVDQAGMPQTKAEFACADAGPQDLELWVLDLAGNTNTCNITITLTDADSSCTLGFIDVGGNLFVANTSVALSGTHPTAPAFNSTINADTQGAFLFNDFVPKGGSYTITPFNDSDHLNGVSTFDLVLISKHILNLELLDNPYKIIAADANRNFSLTTFDIVEIRKLILGIYTKFPANTSWRFVDAGFVFPDPANPFATAFPEKITRTAVDSSRLDENFFAVKTGDVNGSAMPNFAAASEERQRATFYFDLEERAVKVGEEFTVAFTAAGQVQGWQFTLDLKGLELIDIPENEYITSANFGVFDDALTTSVIVPAGSDLDVFSLKFRATGSGRLSEMLHISSRITPAEAYWSHYGHLGHYGHSHNAPNDLNNSPLDIALRFRSPAGTMISHVGFELYQNRPNPFHDQTLIGFNLPEACAATLSIFDETGRLLHAQTSQYGRGYNAVSVGNNIGGMKGVLYYKLDTPMGSAVRKMVLF